MQNFGVTNKDHYGMFWYFLECSIVIVAYQPFISSLNSENDFGAEIKSAIIREKNSLDKEQKNKMNKTLWERIFGRRCTTRT